ncbi:MAG: GNAT family N-acetyltransferase [Myxococcales bacterium]|nr:GNAT family N-acetyltransferase [Myxococcales bacterium]
MNAPTLTARFAVELVSDAARFAALAPEWSELAARAGLDHPFATHEWLSAWWAAFGDGGQRLSVAVVRSRGTCVGIAPLMLTRTRMYGVPLRRLELMANEQSPRNEVLMSDPHAWDALFAHLIAEQGAWDALVLRQLPEGSTTDAALARLGGAHGLRSNTWRAPASPIVRTDGDYQAYLAARPNKLRVNLRNRLKRITKLGPIRYEKICRGAALPQAFEDALRIEAAGWKGGARTAIASRAATRRLYERFTTAASARGWLELRFLTVGERRVAVAYNLRYGGKLYLLKQGYDPELAELAPASLLCDELVRECFAEGVSALDLLGDDEAWKLQWTSECAPHRWWFVFAPHWRARIARVLKFVVAPALRDAPLGAFLRRVVAP